MRTRKRTVVLNGTFSIEEIDVKNKSRRKASKTSGRKVGKATGKKVARKKAAGKKAAKKAARAGKRSSTRSKRKKPTKTDAGTVVLATHPGIKNTAEIKDQLAAAHSASSEVVVDAGKVESIDTAALQLLVAFANSMRKESRTLEWRQTSTVFCEMADLLGLRESLGIVGASASEEDDGLCPVF